MKKALNKQQLNEENKSKLWNYLVMAADGMINTRTDGVI